MGANVSQAMTSVTNSMDQKLTNEAGASAVASCSISTGNIVLKNAKRCSVTNKNLCGASATASLDAIASAASEQFMKLTDTQKTSLPLIGVNVNSTQTDVKTAVRQELSNKCQADANVALSIATKDLIMDGCEDSTIENINTGTAEGNCGIKTVMDTVSGFSFDKTSTQTTGDLFGDIGNALKGNALLVIGISVTSVVVLIIVVILFKKMFGGDSGPQGQGPPQGQWQPQPQPQPQYGPNMGNPYGRPYGQYGGTLLFSKPPGIATSSPLSLTMS